MYYSKCFLLCLLERRGKGSDKLKWACGGGVKRSSRLPIQILKEPASCSCGVLAWGWAWYWSIWRWTMAINCGVPSSSCQAGYYHSPFSQQFLFHSQFLCYIGSMTQPRLSPIFIAIYIYISIWLLVPHTFYPRLQHYAFILVWPSVG